MIESESFLLNNVVIEIVRSARRKTLSIEINSHGVKARAPLRMRHKTVIDFVQSKEQWIKRHLATLPEPKPKLKLENGAELLFLGDLYKLAIALGSNHCVNHSIDSIIVPIKQSHLPLETSISNKLIRWYKKVAQSELQKKVARYALLMDIPRNKKLNINVRDYKRRWGSCDKKGDLSFNWRIIQAPVGVVDYVVIHELAHCHEFNHSKRFWALVAQQMPNWKEHQLWLYTHGPDLYRF